MIKNALDIVNESSILIKKDMSELLSIRRELLQTWETVQIFRTRTEMKISVLNDMKRPTADAKYWQAVREQNVMFQELVLLSYEYRKNILEIMRDERNCNKEKDDIEKALLQVEIDKKKFIGKNMERTAHDRIREILEWSAIKKELLPHLKYGDKDVDAHQLEAMQKSFSRQAKLVNNQTSIAEARNIIGLADMANKAGGKNGIYQIK